MFCVLLFNFFHNLSPAVGILVLISGLVTFHSDTVTQKANIYFILLKNKAIVLSRLGTVCGVCMLRHRRFTCIKHTKQVGRDKCSCLSEESENLLSLSAVNC